MVIGVFDWSERVHVVATLTAPAGGSASDETQIVSTRRGR